MNIEIANRLVDMRKKKGLSQEQLAEKLGLSRQAVSKWERAEASPDTDNLICLAKLYGVSLDDLLKTDQPVEEIVGEKAAETAEQDNKDTTHAEDATGKKTSTVHIGANGIHVVDEDGSEVHIGVSGIHVHDGKDNVDIGPSGIHFHDKPNSKLVKFRDVFSSIFGLAVVITYVMLGIFLDLWHPGWLIFLSIPVVGSIFDCFINKKITKFAYPVLVVAAYLFIGFQYGGWHPWWVLFLSIPLFYVIFKPIEHLWLKDECCGVNIESSEKDDDDDDDDKDDDKDDDREVKNVDINIKVDSDTKIKK